MIEDLWNYEFYSYEPDENNTISIDDWLKTIIVSLAGVELNRYRK
jgi:hypothetical protein